MDKYYFANTVDDIFDNITGTNKCPMCEDVVAESRSILKRHFDSRHFRYAIFYEIDGKQACILPCRRECGIPRRSRQEGRRAHFHCPFCEQMYGRSTSFRHHLMKTQGNCFKGNENKSGCGKNDVNRNIMLVQEVEKYEELYNHEADGFNDKDEQNLAWTAISYVMNEDETSCIARWKRLRAIYYQYMKSTVNTDRQISKHYLCDHMKFMIPHMKCLKVKVKTERHPTIEIMTDLPPDNMSLDNLSADNLSGDNLSRGSLSPNNLSPNNIPPAPFIRKELTRSLPPERFHVRKETKPFRTNSYKVSSENRRRREQQYSSPDEDDAFYEESIPRKRRRPNYNEADDADMAFFRSLLPDVHKMDLRQKSRFKRITLGIIEDILYSSSMTKEGISLPNLGSDFVEKV